MLEKEEKKKVVTWISQRQRKKGEKEDTRDSNRLNNHLHWAQGGADARQRRKEANVVTRAASADICKMIAEANEKPPVQILYHAGQ